MYAGEENNTQFVTLYQLQIQPTPVLHLVLKYRLEVEADYMKHWRGIGLEKGITVDS